MQQLKQTPEWYYRNYSSTTAQPNKLRITITKFNPKNHLKNDTTTMLQQHTKENLTINSVSTVKDWIPALTPIPIMPLLIRKKTKHIPKEKCQLTIKNFCDSYHKKTKKEGKSKKWKDNDSFLSMHKKPPDSKTSNNKISTSREFSHPLVTASWNKEEKDSLTNGKAKENKENNNSKTLMAP